MYWAIINIMFVNARQNMTKAIKISTRLFMVWISKILTILATAFYSINLEWYLKSNYVYFKCYYKQKIILLQS
jgi:hypothetical protein